MILAPKQHKIKTRLTTELDKELCVTQIEAHYCGLESLYPVFKDASIKRFVEQNSANSLCFVRQCCFFLTGGEGSIAVS